MMAAKLHFFLLLVFLTAYKVHSSCYSDDDCIYGHCCEDNICYNYGENCPIVNTIAGGVVAAIVISVVVFVGIIVTIILCCCCACCPCYHNRTPGHVIVTQPGYQQFGTNVVVQSSTTQTAAAPPAQYHPQGPPAYAQQGYPPQGYPPQYSQPPPKY